MIILVFSDLVYPLLHLFVVFFDFWKVIPATNKKGCNWWRRKKLIYLVFCNKYSWFTTTNIFGLLQQIYLVYCNKYIWFTATNIFGLLQQICLVFCNKYIWFSATNIFDFLRQIYLVHLTNDFVFHFLLCFCKTWSKNS